MKAMLMLKDGFTLTGETFTGHGEVLGEVVFNTGMTGYQEMITDPSYSGQILTFTYPLIGNYGCNDDYNESALARAEAVLVKEYCPRPHSLYSRENLAQFLRRHNIPGIEGIDTRTLTLHLRRMGTMKGIISTSDSHPGILKKKLDLYPGISGIDLAKDVTTDVPYCWDKKGRRLVADTHGSSDGAKHVAVLDLGVKYSILQALSRRDCRLTVLPAGTPADDIKALNPDGILLSNGPGDPAALDYLLPTVTELMGWRPIMGICLGHQIIGRALGIDTFKLVFGHRGGNHPVRETKSERVFITAQNHGFCLRADAPLPPGTEVTHINLNDKTVEGIENDNLGFFSVQFHPEAGPGPHDCVGLFDKFVGMM